MRKYFIISGAWLLSKMPWWMLHILAFKLYVIAYYIVGYRKKVVQDNLLKCFPDKSSEELKAVEKKFYKHFTDLIIEALKGFSISKEKLVSRYTIKNPEILKEFQQAENSGIMLFAHYNNWEWNAIFAGAYFIDNGLRMTGAYKPLSDKVMDKIMLDYRTRFGGRLISSKESREMIRNLRSDDPVFFIMIADQVPARENVMKVKFLGRETSFFKGPAWMAVNCGSNLYYQAIRKVSRHRYEIEFIKMYDARNKVEDKNKLIEDLTAKYAHHLEQQILDEPANWLWSHKRWKHDSDSDY